MRGPCPLLCGAANIKLYLIRELLIQSFDVNYHLYFKRWQRKEEKKGKKKKKKKKDGRKYLDLNYMLCYLKMIF